MTAVINGDSMQSPPDFFMKSDTKLSLCGCFRLGMLALQYMRLDKFVCDLHDANVPIICPVCDVTHMRNVPSPPPLTCTASDRKLGLQSTASLLIGAKCSCSWQDVRALWLLHKSNSVANWCTKSANRVL